MAYQNYKLKELYLAKVISIGLVPGNYYNYLFFKMFNMKTVLLEQKHSFKRTRKIY